MFNNFSALTHVQHLYLSTNTLNGVILDDLNRCHNLVYLNLSHNILGGELMSIGLIVLEKLDLSTNRFHGEVKFSFPAICHKLVVANLSMNNFWGSIDYFDGCWNLQYLDLSSNNFSGNTWTGFARLIEFSVAENYFTGSVPVSCFMENCTVQILDLSENKFQSEPSSNNLVTLNLWGNNFSGPIPLELGLISTLESLLLGNNRFSILIPESLLNLKKLASLDLRNNSFGGKVQDIFGRFTQLKSLVLYGNSYTDGILSSGIHKLTNMSRLDLSYNNFSGELPVEISQMLGLKFLILAYNQFTGDIPSVYGDLSHLQALDLSFNGLS
ncbi:putative LRR receptor-like serine/threonine-protein kinase [Gossypium australe]|uniref:Putative LRR receptor-like serine/threonine-protein kinase n=1 Tax=Gossypium australe TaxID=47621 RepID=A0A5B6V4R1_9ROSI|nr:putative LRR receptor-like serine/threonine-protein kinase [Gossypium australe]